MRITQDDQSRIAQAIAAAEAATSGEVFCVVSRRVSSYGDVALAWSAAAALILPALLIPFGFEGVWPFGGGWEAAHESGLTVGRALGGYVAVQAAVFAGILLLSLIPTVRRWMTPGGLRRARVRRAALQQFLAHGVHVTRERTGVLIFAALDDHQVELIADEGIHAQVDQGVWGDAVAALTTEMKAGRPAQGFEIAIGQCGQVLARHFPPRTDNPNELPDHLVIL